jgi:ribosomal protein S27E
MDSQPNNKVRNKKGVNTMMRFVKQSVCSSCKKTAIVYQTESGYIFHCLNCGKHLVEVDPTLYQDSVKQAMMGILKRLRPTEDLETLIPKTAGWRDVLVTILGLIDVQNLENERFRKFFRENHMDKEPQLSFYHMLKRTKS